MLFILPESAHFCLCSGLPLHRAEQSSSLGRLRFCITDCWPKSLCSNLLNSFDLCCKFGGLLDYTCDPIKPAV